MAVNISDFYSIWWTSNFSILLFPKKLAQLGKIRNELSEVQLRNLQDGIGGIKEIKLLGREIYFLKQFDKNTNKLASINIQNSIIYGTPRLVIEFFAICSVATIIFTFLILGKSIIEILPTLGLFFCCSL